MLIDKLVTYKALDLQKPTIPTRSHLYCLEPIGVGTPYVESLASYIARIAQVHCVSTRTLVISRLSSFFNRPQLLNNNCQDIYSIFGSHTKTHSLNGIGVNSKILIEALQALTLRNDLHFLTLLPWVEVLPWKCLVRPVKAWCSNCYQSWRRTNSIVYDPLIWALNVVKICPQHYQYLQTRCIHCNKQNYLLMSYSRPGYCSYCRNWLGDSSIKADNTPSFKKLELRQQLLVLRNIENLLIAAPTLSFIPLKERVTRNIVACINQATGGNRTAFARLLEISSQDAQKWYLGETKPPLNRLLQICDVFGTSLLDFLTTDIVSLDIQKLTQVISKQKYQLRKPQVSSKQFDFEQVRQVLQSALNQSPPRSIAEVVKQLDSNKRFLCRHFPELYNALVSKYADYKRSLLQQKRLVLEAVLESNEYPPPSLQEVGRRIGSHRKNLAKLFPDISRAISKRYLDYRRVRGIESKERIRQQVRQVALELHSKGQIPHGEIIGRFLPQSGTMRGKTAQSALSEIRRELGYDK